ncbi:MAG: hypothetical protein Q7J57_05215 [Gemmobacter sp.]|nr:hypothetical protein [Gemmobacter sp.]
MKVIIHPGMHKTCTRSIQAFLKANCTGDFCYAPLSSENQSALLVLLFQDLDMLKDYHGFRTQGGPYATDPPELRKRICDPKQPQQDKALCALGLLQTTPAQMPID